MTSTMKAIIARPDLMQRSGAIPLPPGVTDVLGLEVAGRVVDGDAALRGRSVMPPLADAAEAHRILEASETIGKVVLLP